MLEKRFFDGSNGAAGLDPLPEPFPPVASLPRLETPEARRAMGPPLPDGWILFPVGWGEVVFWGVDLFPDLVRLVLELIVVEAGWVDLSPEMMDGVSFVSRSRVRGEVRVFKPDAAL